MTTLSLHNQKLIERVEQAAQSQNRTVDLLLDEAVNEYLERWESEKIQSEQKAFEQLHPKLAVEYFGHYVAIHNGELIDHDLDERVLHLRIRQRFGRMPILLRKVTQDPSVPIFYWRSPRLEWISP